MNFTHKAQSIFDQAIHTYHQPELNDVDAPFVNPHPEGTIESYLYKKVWIDTVQWHLEDLIRDPQIDPAAALLLKRRIDKSNQERTDLVEHIDDYFRSFYQYVTPSPQATLNTESVAWAIDRLSILALKIYHMREETLRQDALQEHRLRCTAKLAVLVEQQHDLMLAIDQLLSDIAAGNKYMKVYKQMKMYNDAETNPILYQQNKK